MLAQHLRPAVLDECNGITDVDIDVCAAGRCKVLRGRIGGCCMLLLGPAQTLVVDVIRMALQFLRPNLEQLFLQRYFVLAASVYVICMALHGQDLRLKHVTT